MSNGSGNGAAGTGEADVFAGSGAALEQSGPLEVQVLTDVAEDGSSGAQRSTSNPFMAGFEPAAPVAPSLPMVPPAKTAPAQPTADGAQRARARIEGITKEAQASSGAEAAALWFEVGRLYEHDLADLRNAAGAYQEAHKADPSYLPVIHAARRLFAHLGKWGMVVVLIDEELKLPDAAVTALLVEKARLFETRLPRPDDAVALYQQALAVDQGYAPAVDGLVRHLEQRAAWAEVVQVLRASARATARLAQRGAWLQEIGRICEARLKDDAGALAAYEEAEAALPGRRAVLEVLRRLYARAGEVEKQGRALERLAETAGSAGEAVTFLSERARLLAAAGNDRGAVVALEQARTRAPDDPLLLAELSRLYERLELWPALVEALEAHARCTHDRAELLALGAEAGKTAEEKLHDVERAIRLYGNCVEVDPGYGPALTALGKLFAKTKRYRELSSVYDVQISSATDPQQRSNLLFKQAELLADKLAEPEAALLRLNEVLKLQPGWVPAQKLNSALLARLSRWEDLLTTYEAELTSMLQASGRTDRDQAIFLLEKVAGVIEDKLGDPARAVDVYKRMLSVQPGYLPALRSLGRLYAGLERWEDLLQVNTEEAELVSDQNHIVSLLFKNGEILADRLGRIEEAIRAYRQALTLMPTYLPALKALGSIYARAGRWMDLIGMHAEEAEVAKRPEQRAYLRFMVAQIFDEQLRDKEQAKASYRSVLDEDPHYHPAMRALARLASVDGDWEGLLDVYRKELAVLTEARDRALLRCRIAEILDRRLGRVDEAIKALQDAIADSSYLLAAHEQLVAVYARLGRSEDEAVARGQMHQVLPDVQGRVANLRVIADLALHRLDHPERALEAAQRILYEVQSDRAALRLGVECALKLRDYQTAVELSERLARIEPSADEVANLHLQIASWKESHVEPPQDALPNYLRVLEFEPHNPTAMRAVERAYFERQAWDGLFLLYQRESERLATPALIADRQLRMGEIAERLQKPDDAIACYEKTLEAMPGHIPAITRLKELYQRLGRSSDQLRMLSMEAQSSKDPVHAVRTLLEVGALQRDRYGNIDAAVDCFTRVLDRDPQNAQAYSSLETLLVTNSRWEALARLYVRRSSGVTELPQKVELLIKAAHILGERLRRFGESAEAYTRVLALVPNHTGALLQIGNLRFTLQEWGDAVEAYERLTQVAGDPVMLVPVHFNLGVIFSEHRPDAQRAIQHLTSCLAMQPENREARRRLAASYALAGSPAQALTAYRQLADSATDRAEKRETHQTLARLYETGFNDTAQAAAQLEAALALTDDHAAHGALLDEIAALYERSGNLQRFIEITHKQAEQAASVDPKRAAELFYRNARMQLERLKDAEGALKSARRAVEIAPDHHEARGFVADLLGRTPNQTPLAIEEHRRILKMGHLRAASVHALFKAWQQQRAQDRSFVAAEILSFIGAADETEELFFNENKRRLKRSTDEQLAPGQLRGWVLHPGQRNVISDVLAVAAQDLGKPFSDADVDAADKKGVLRPKTDDPVRSMCDDVARAFGVSGFDVVKSEARRTLVRAFNGAPPLLYVGVDVAKLQPTREQRFLVAREALALWVGNTLIRGLDARGLGSLLTAIGRTVERTFPLVGEASDLESLTKRVGGALSRKTKAALAEPVAVLAASVRSLDLNGYLQAAPLSEARAGLLLSGAFDAAVRILAKEAAKPLAGETAKLAATIEGDPRLADLVGYALSDDHFQARQALRLAIDAP
ncbi:MAG: tetratricopeptide repeat protein [Deltaproteobacteria bacterium]|nr:tetratricopeptide repeat protein [Deltaproteobacteria bacterium]